jgi:PAS domain S-box-containing protein
MVNNEGMYNLMLGEIEDYAILLLDVKGNVRTWNKGAEKIKEYTAEEIIGKNFNLFYTIEDRENKLPERLIEEALLKGKATSEGWRMKKDGALFWGSILITAIHDENRKVVGFSKITRDLTEKKNADETQKLLVQDREGFLKIFNSSPSGMVITDLESNIYIEVNENFLTTFGYNREEVIGLNALDLKLVSDETKKTLAAKLKKQGYLKNEEVRAYTKSRKEIICIVSADMIEMAENKHILYVFEDITEHVKAEITERNLIQTKEGFLKIFNSSPSGMIITDLESRKYVEINKNFLETFGYSREEVIGSSPDRLGLVSTQDKAKLASKLSRQGYLKNEEVLCITKTGHEITCIVSADILEMDDKKYFLSIYHDITERKNAEETERALVQSKVGLLKIFNASPSGMIIADTESGRLMEVNKSFLTTFGYSLQEAIGLTADELGFVSHETQLRSFTKLKEQGYLRNEEVPGYTKERKEIDTIFSVEPFEMDGKNCFLCIFHDITGLKEMERKLVDSENKYRGIIEEAGDVLYTADANGVFIYINKRVTILTGYTEAELIGKHFSVLIAPEWQERVRDSYRNQFKHKVHELMMEFVIHTKAGDEKWVEQVVIMQIDKGIIKGFQCIVRDITERKKANLLLAEQKQIIEQKNKDILDSINYAKRIQDAIFPPEELVKELLPQSFILFRPKDIISGDFYWIEKFDNKTYIAAVDCTGHGVPGALLSIIGYNLLSKSINEHEHSRPSEILDEVSSGINKALRQTMEGGGIKDTMDIALCSIDRTTNTLEYAGAYNSLYLVRGSKLTEIAANRFPIGVFLSGEPQQFTNHQMQLEKGDMIYLFSDGYPDQFGGPRGKKFKYAGFRELLLSVHNLPLEKQRQVLDKTLEEWKWMTEEQTDDILVIGIRI